MPPHAAPDKEKVGMRQREYRSKIRVTKFFTCVKLWILDKKNWCLWIEKLIENYHFNNYEIYCEIYYICNFTHKNKFMMDFIDIIHIKEKKIRY